MPALSVFWGSAIPVAPQHGPNWLLGDSSLRSTMASLCYVQWYCFTLHLEGLGDAIALLYSFFLTEVVVVVRWLRTSTEGAGKGQQQEPGVRKQD